MDFIKNFLKPLSNLNKLERSQIFIIFILYFQSLFSYPLFRSAVDAMFLDSVGASKTPLVWLYSIILLTIAVTLYNKYYKKIGVPNLITYSVFFAICTFIIFALGLVGGTKLFAYPLYVVKEVYIIVLIHMILGFANSVLNLNQAKILYGFIGAAGGVGGILGGILTVKLSATLNELEIIFVGCLILLPCLFYAIKLNQFKLRKSVDELESNKNTPLNSIKGAGNYVFLIICIVCLSQFAINIVAFDFKMFVSETILSTTEKTAFFGRTYALVNTIALATQLVLLPLMFKFLSLRSIHLIVPSVFLILSGQVFLFSLGGVSLLFMTFKGLDYSLFSSAKELLYYPLTKIQRYGAKYLTDMIFYRAAKGFISILLIYYQSREGLRYTLLTILVLWFVSVLLLFKISSRRGNEN